MMMDSDGGCNDEQEDSESVVSKFITLSLECPVPNCNSEFCQFTNQDLLNDHLLEYHSIHPFPCYVKDCTRSYGSSQRLLKHVSKRHSLSDSIDFHCDHCTKHYPSYERLAKHTVGKHHFGVFQCAFKDCEFMSLTKRTKVRAHFRREHSQVQEPEQELMMMVDDGKEEEEEEEKNVAESTVKAKSSVKAKSTVNDDVDHEKVSRKSSKSKRILEPLKPNPKKKNLPRILTLRLKCLHPPCSRMFDSPNKLDAHLFRKHSIQKYRCVVKGCRKSFPNCNAFGAHRKSAHLHTTQWFCDHCRDPPKHFRTYNLLYNHTQRQHHFGEFQCSYPECTFEVQSKRVNIFSHYDQVHAGLFTCQKGCSYRTYNLSVMRTHERTHARIKMPFGCSWPRCGHTSGSQGGALQHIRSVHFKSGKGSGGKGGKRLVPKDFLKVLVLDDGDDEDRRVEDEDRRVDDDEDRRVEDEDRCVDDEDRCVDQVEQDHEEHCTTDVVAQLTDVENLTNVPKSADVVTESTDVSQSADVVTESTDVPKSADVVTEPTDVKHLTDVITDVLTQSTDAQQANIDADDVHKENNPPRPLKRQRTSSSPSPRTIKNSQFLTLSLNCLQPDCASLFDDQEHLDDHLQSDHCIEKYRCAMKDCCDSFKSSLTLSQHLEQQHSNAKWSCSQCTDRVYASYSLLSMHTVQYHQLGQFVCSFPDCRTRQYNSRIQVYNHYVAEHNNIYERPKVQTPSRSSNRLSSKAQTYLQSAKDSNKPYRCKWPGCSHSSTYRFDTLRHVRVVHCSPNSVNSLPNLSRDPKDFVEVVHQL